MRKQINWRQCFVDLRAAYQAETGKEWPMPTNPYNRRSDVSDEEIRRLYLDKGLTMEQIGSIVGCAGTTVHNRLAAMGVDRRKPEEYPRSEAQRAAFAAMQENNLENGCLREETKRKLSAALKGRPMNEETRRKNSERRRAKRQARWEYGGHEVRKSGYIYVYCPEHPQASATGYVAKHRLVMERELHRYLGEDEVVHHINHIRDDNRLENLQVMDKTEHYLMHLAESRKNLEKAVRNGKAYGKSKEANGDE